MSANDTPWTPGPWKSPDDDTDINDVMLFPLVGDFHDHEDDEDVILACARCTANARLIAAAPEMADVLGWIMQEDTPAGRRAAALLARIRGES